MAYSAIFFILCAATAVSAEALKYPIDEAERLFEEFIQKYNKVYAHDQERNERFDIFIQNLHDINARNEDDENTAEYAINHFSDLSHEEKQHALGLLLSKHETKYNCKTKEFSDLKIHSASAPSSWNWVEQGAVSSVKNQAPCQNCWTFSAVGNLEGQYAIKHKELIEFSVQELTDCAGDCMTGGYMDDAFGYWINNTGAISEKDYPYVGITDGVCKAKSFEKSAKLVECYMIDLHDNEQKLMEVLYNVGPISIAIDAKDIMHYSGNVVKKCDNNELNHAVLLVGYGTSSDGLDYWLVKNSWGAGWGEKGYFRLQRDQNMCGIVNYLMSTSVVE